ncbi:hypothetical protein GUITHDRAFT_122234 [Guillardia theta CCMP2712]|uniref:Protein kinase domain-containing protein n=1 Tax=Guillardia theta (strain CCMP2712) TaxID=905079 RepID=L1I6R3_GUITC|nr:hypothetical protein GUITHDRAFT_122234 [Guillardia theta CCMP2712]EKX31574.1 hypothetical protein GUITHDRAFT_122234 [Guillardia theta CCMP2712]|eukprot:XP_005818554.1 hypothetical protein GUITHDRAFT_122234 [Guillardia theta CCMP2712]
MSKSFPLSLLPDVIKDFKLKVEFYYPEDENEVRTIGRASQLCPRFEANMADLVKLPERGCGMQGQEKHAIWDFLNRCLDIYLRTRMTAQEALKHPFIASGIK